METHPENLVEEYPVNAVLTTAYISRGARIDVASLRRLGGPQLAPIAERIFGAFG